MVLDELVPEMPGCKIRVIHENPVLVIISKLEISAIEDLVILYMAEKLQEVIAIVAILYLIPIKLLHIIFQLAPD